MLDKLEESSRYAIQSFFFLSVVSILGNVSFVRNAKEAAESALKDCEEPRASELSLLRRRSDCSRSDRFLDFFLPLSHIIESQGSFHLSNETGALVMFLTWLGLVIFLSLVSAHDVVNGHFATLAFLIGGLAALMIAYVLWNFLSSMCCLATARAVVSKSSSDAVLQTLVNGQACGEITSLVTLTAFLFMNLVLSYGGIFEEKSDSSVVSDCLCGVALGIAFVSMTLRITSGIFSKSSNVGSSLITLETDCEPVDNPVFLAAIIGDGLSSTPATAVDVASVIAEAFVAYITIGSLNFELSGLPGFGLTLFPLGVLCCGFLASSFVFRVAQLWTTQYFPASASQDPRALKLWLMQLNRTMLLGTLVLLVPAVTFMAHATLPDDFVTSKLSHDHVNGNGNQDLHKGNVSAANQHELMFKMTPTLVAIVTLLGTLVGAVIALLAEIFYGPRSKAVISLVQDAGFQLGTLSTQADALGHAAILPFVSLLALMALLGYYLAGAYGISLIALGITALAPLVVGLLSHSSNYELSRLCHLAPHIRSTTRALHEVSLNTHALTQGYLLTANSFAVVAVWCALGVKFSAYLADSDLFSSLNVLQPMVIILVILGAALPNFFAASLGRAISSAGTLIFEESLRIISCTNTTDSGNSSSSLRREGASAAMPIASFRASKTAYRFGYQSIETKEQEEREAEMGGQAENKQRTAKAGAGGESRGLIKFSKDELLRPCSIAATASLRDALGLALIALMVPVAAGVLFGVLPVFAVLIGSLLSSLCMSIPLLVSGQSLEMVRFCLLGHWESRVGKLQPGLSESAIIELYGKDEAQSASADDVDVDVDVEAAVDTLDSAGVHSTTLSEKSRHFRHNSQLITIAEELSGSARAVVAPSLQVQHKVQGLLCLVFITVFLSINSGRGVFNI